MTFLITGGTRGIGAGVARAAAGYGARVAVSGTDADAGKTVVASIEATGGEALFVSCDVTDREQVQQMMVTVGDHFGGIDVLHNNAGVHESALTTDVSIEDMDPEVWDRVLAINLRGPWLCAKYALPYLKRSRRNPSIINSGSTGGLVGFPASLAYGPSKGGLNLLTKNLAVELAPHGIRANSFCAASVQTDMVERYLEAAEDREATLRTMSATHLVPRIGTPEDVAHLVCFLASEQASFVNGVTWLIDGGAFAWRGSRS
ncbi:SDR family NAD(P)-dependent oxidoreductase [Micromonospora sp. SH-82]|uniref:SDR family NAD(P)-dependent oxidoreductase n=1 Tax=Micromonospora sp. SH-82 TaxID=3132938 RepID=UPI003EBEA9F7